MKIFIAIPCMDSVNTLFFQSVLSLNMESLGSPKYGVSRSSLIYDARNALAQTAIEAGAERIMWLDSDMVFEPDVIQRLSADMDEGREFVSGIYFKRKNPVAPVVYKKTGYIENGNKLTPYAVEYADYPKDEIFDVAGVGFGCCMMAVDLLKQVYEKYGAPFAPSPGFGEDLSLCRRLEEMGVKMWCDSRVKAGHVASTIVTEDSYIRGITL